MKVMIENARVAFAHGLFKASALEEGQQPKFGADFILEEASKVFEIQMVDGKKVRVPTTMDAVMLAVANAAPAWKGKGKTILDSLEPSKKSYRDGNRRVNKAGDIYEGFEDRMYVTAKSPNRPSIFDRARAPLTEQDGKPYSGCYVNVLFDVYANTDPKKKGVFAGLTGVQFVRDGDSFGGGSRASEDDFDDLADGAEAGDLA